MANRQTWEYLVLEDLDEWDLNKLGAEGWELVSTSPRGTFIVSYLKRPMADLRERVTLDHRQRFVAAAGNQSGSEA